MYVVTVYILPTPKHYLVLTVAISESAPFIILSHEPCRLCNCSLQLNQFVVSPLLIRLPLPSSTRYARRQHIPGQKEGSSGTGDGLGLVMQCLTLHPIRNLITNILRLMPCLAQHTTLPIRSLSRCRLPHLHSSASVLTHRLNVDSFPWTYRPTSSRHGTVMRGGAWRVYL